MEQNEVAGDEQSAVDATQEEKESHFARLVLEGERFEGARLPIDALIELQRYRELVLESARRAWMAANPNDPLPEDFDVKFDLAITDVEVGSAESVLDYPKSEYDEYYALGRDQVESLFADIINHNFGVQLPSGSGEALETTAETAQEIAETAEEVESKKVESIASLVELSAFREFGSSLHPGETLELPETASRKRISVSSEGWRSAIQPIVEVWEMQELPPERPKSLKYDTTVAGRLTALNAERRSFKIHTLHFGEVSGRYLDDALTADMKAVLDSSALAPLVRITGRMSWRNGDLYRILDAKSVELLEIDTEPWSRRMVELASLPPNWDPEVPSTPVISFAAIDAAREVLRAAVECSPVPGIYPQSDGGLVVEWGTPSRVVTLEISPEPSFFLFHLDVASKHVNEVDTENLDEIKELVKDALL